MLPPLGEKGGGGGSDPEEVDVEPTRSGTEGVPQSSAAEKANPEEVQRTSDGRPLQVATSFLHKM